MIITSNIYSNINTLKWRSCHYLICLTLQLRKHQERPRKTRYHVREYPEVNFLFVIDRESWKNRSNSHVENASRSFKIQNGDVSVAVWFIVSTINSSIFTDSKTKMQTLNILFLSDLFDCWTTTNTDTTDLNFNL